METEQEDMIKYIDQNLAEKLNYRLFSFLEAFKKESDKNIADLDKAIQEQNIENVRALVHKMCGTAAMVGSLAFQNKARQISEHAKQDDYEQAAYYFEELVVLYQHVLEEMLFLADSSDQASA